jgi:hypothetical protein
LKDLKAIEKKNRFAIYKITKNDDSNKIIKNNSPFFTALEETIRDFDFNDFGEIRQIAGNEGSPELPNQGPLGQTILNLMKERAPTKKW